MSTGNRQLMRTLSLVRNVLADYRKMESHMSIINAMVYTFWILPWSFLLLVAATIIHVLILDFDFLEDVDMLLWELGEGFLDVWRAVFHME